MGTDRGRLPDWLPSSPEASNCSRWNEEAWVQPFTREVVLASCPSVLAGWQGLCRCRDGSDKGKLKPGRALSGETTVDSALELWCQDRSQPSNSWGRTFGSGSYWVPRDPGPFPVSGFQKQQQHKSNLFYLYLCVCVYHGAGIAGDCSPVTELLQEQ